MDIHGLKIAKRDIELVASEVASPKSFAGLKDACEVYSNARPFLAVAVPLLQALYPPGGAALVAAMAILDKACQQPGG